MNKQSLLEKFIYYIVGIIFFISYYLLMTEFFKINPFQGSTIIITIYFLLAILTFPKAGNLLSDKIEDYMIAANVVMPVAYIAGPIMLLINKLY